MTPVKYTKDELIKIVFENQGKMIETMDKVTNAIKTFNDNNILHNKALKQSIDANTKATDIMSNNTKSMLKLFQWMIISLTLAIIVLAGAEKVLKFLP